LLDDRGYVGLLKMYLARAGYTCGAGVSAPASTHEIRFISRAGAREILGVEPVRRTGTRT
jgi:hypothetical protein